MPATLLRTLFSAGSGIAIDATGTISTGSASSIKVGAGLSVAADGTISVTTRPRSIRDWGAACDGVADDSLALAAAAAELRGTGGTIYIPGDCRLRLAGAAQVWLSGVRLLGDGVREIGNPAAPGAYGLQGSSILIASAGASPFVVSDDWSIEGLNVFWTGQTEAAAVANGGNPAAYPPLIVPHGTDQVRNWSFRNNQVQNAYDLIDLTAAAGVGPFWFRDNSVFALRYALRLRSVGDESWLTDNQFTPGAMTYGVLGMSTTHLLDYSTLHAEVMRVEGDGTPTSAASTAVEGQRWVSNYVFAVRYGLHVVGGGYNIASWTANSFDQVSTVIALDSGGVMSLDVHGGVILSGRLFDPSLVTPAITVAGGFGGSRLTLNGVEIDVTSGNGVSFADPGAGALSILGGKIGSVGQASDGVAFDGVRFDAAGGMLTISGTVITDTNPVSGAAGSAGVAVVNAKASAVSGVVLGGWTYPYSNVSALGRHTLTGSTSYGSLGAAAVSGGAGVALAGNSWDIPAGQGRPGLVVVASGAAYAMADGDRLVLVRKAVGSATTVALPVHPVPSENYVVKDARGDAAVHPITVNGGTIDGAPSFVVGVNFGALTVVFNGTDWSVV